MVRADNGAAAGCYRAIGYAQQDVIVLGRRLDGSGGTERSASRNEDAHRIGGGFVLIR